MPRSCSGLHVIIVLVLSSLLVSTPAHGHRVLSQTDGEERPTQVAEPTPAAPEATPVRPLPAGIRPMPLGSCELSALSLSRPWIGRYSEIEWWAVGLMPAATITIRLVDSSGRTTQLGSAPVDTLCEASGILATENRTPGAYTLVISGTRPGGGAVELTASFNIVSLSRTPPSAPVSAPEQAPTPAPPGGVRARALDQSTIRLDWTDNSDNETGFLIDGEAGQFRLPRNTTTTNVGGLQPLSWYCFSVYAFNAAGESSGSTSCAFTLAPTR